MTELQKEDQVVLVDFWTYTCINCIRTLPELRSWEEQYGDEGLTIVGVHAPEFPFERETGNVENAIDEYDLEYPVVQDNELATWDAFRNQYWPAKYLIDADGEIRYTHFGEGDYETTEAAIRSLLAEAGHKPGAEAEAEAETADPGLATPETYLGAARAQGWLNGPIDPGRQDFRGGRRPAPAAERLLLPRRLGRHPGVGDRRRERRDRPALQGPPRLPGARRRGRPGRGPRPARRRAAAGLGGRRGRLGRRRPDRRAAPLPPRRPAEGRRPPVTLEFDPGVEGYAFTFG